MTGVIAARAAQTNVSFEQMQQTYLERISLRRMVTPEDIAASVAYLLSPAGRNVSGQSLSVDANVEAI
jgi:enoyl-[acyl-carrier-protein] reductase (NADH)